jgi:hypothetical protein
MDLPNRSKNQKPSISLTIARPLAPIKLLRGFFFFFVFFVFFWLHRGFTLANYRIRGHLATLLPENNLSAPS